MKNFFRRKKEAVKVVEVGRSNRRFYVLWGLLGSAVLVGLVRGCTAKGVETIREEKVIEKVTVEEKVVDTTGLEYFVECFVRDYFTYSSKKEMLSHRSEQLSDYLPALLLAYANQSVRSDIPVVSTVEDVAILRVERLGPEEFRLTFRVLQKVQDGNEHRDVVSVYSVTVRQDSSGALICTSLPVYAQDLSRCDYEVESVRSSVSNEEQEAIHIFFETFFKLYPKADAQELLFYAKEGVLPVLQRALVFSSLQDEVYVQQEKNVKASLTVEYLNQETKQIEFCTYRLLLEKGENWRIVGSF